MSRWVQHCKEFSKSNGCSYKDAMKDPECKSSYHGGKEGGAFLGIKHMDRKATRVLKFQNKATQLIGKPIAALKIPLVSNAAAAVVSANQEIAKLADDTTRAKSREHSRARKKRQIKAAAAAAEPANPFSIGGSFRTHTGGAVAMKQPRQFSHRYGGSQFDTKEDHIRFGNSYDHTFYRKESLNDNPDIAYPPISRFYSGGSFAPH